MNIDITGLCRGGAKVFFKLSVKGVDSGNLVSFSASANDDPVPYMAFEVDGCSPVAEPSIARDFVIVLPQLSVDIAFAVKLSSPQADIIACEERIIKPGSAKWQSRINRVMNPSTLSEIRNCDYERTLDRAVIEFHDCVTVRDTRVGSPMVEECIYHGSAYVPCSLSPGDFSLRCFDGSFAEAPGSFTYLPPKMLEESENKTAPLWRLDFAFRAPLALNGLTCFAVGSDGSAIVGFESLLSGQIGELKERVANYFESAESDEGYHDWLLARRPNRSELALQRSREFAVQPKISLIVLLRSAMAESVRKMVDSVLAQTYPHFELMLINGCTQDPKLQSKLEESSKRDSRIVILGDNGAFPPTINDGIIAASGDYLAFMGQADTLEPNALFEYVAAINDDPLVDMLYCDEDRLQANGRFGNPSFKPDFSIDLLRSSNYIRHLLVVRAEMARSLAASGILLDDGLDHYDLILRSVERTGNIGHIDKVLYHCCEAHRSAQSAQTPEAEPNAGVAMVREHLGRLGIAADISPYHADGNRVDYRVEGNPSVSIVIPSKDNVDTLQRCLASISGKTNYGNYEIVIVENNSTQSGTFDYYEGIQAQDRRIRVEKWEGVGFNYSALVNFGASKAHGEYLLFLNNDTEVITPDWITHMLGYCQREDVGVVGVRLRYPDDTIQHVGVVVTNGCIEHLGYHVPVEDRGYMALFDQARDVSAVTGACMMVEKRLFEEVGGYDESLAVVFNDIDFCLRLRERGKLVVFTPFAELYHHESFTRGKEDTDSKRFRFVREMTFFWCRWPDYYAKGDPYYNGNLAQQGLKINYYHLAR